jgi:hypothetical protein
VEDQILEKIRAEIERGIKTESQAVYLLVEVRKLLDKKAAANDRYALLRLYCNWVVHVELTNTLAKQIVRTADSLYKKLVSGIDAETSNLTRIFSLDMFREELGEFLEANKLTRFSGSEWIAFSSCVLNVIEDCPLLCKGDTAGGSAIDEVVIMRDAGRVPDGNPQGLIWGLCGGGKLRMSFGGYPDEEEEIDETIEAFLKSRDQ